MGHPVLVVETPGFGGGSPTHDGEDCHVWGTRLGGSEDRVTQVGGRFGLWAGGYGVVFDSGGYGGYYGGG